MKILSFLLFNVIFIYLSFQFIVATGKGFTKCYFSDVSPDKTLDIRFGFPRREKYNCKFRLDIDFLASKDYQYEDENLTPDTKLYYGEFFCYEMTPRYPFVYKHTTSESYYSGQYRVCVQNQEDFNQNSNATMFELQIAERFDPSMLQEGISAPLVYSAYLIDLYTIILEIKKTLKMCQTHIKNVEDAGDLVAKGILESATFTSRATYTQIISLIIYGIIWVIVVTKIGK